MNCAAIQYPAAPPVRGIKGDLLKKDVLYSLCIFFVIFISGLLYYNRIALDMEGWEVFYGLQMAEGKRMYADFFVYTPPFYIFISIMRWYLCHGSLLLLRLLGLTDRALLFVAIYLVLGRWFKKENAFFATLFGFYLFNTLPFNSYSDYTQYAQLMSLLGVYFASKFTEAYLDPIQKEKNRDVLWLFLGGLFASNALMCKQSIGVGLLGMFFLSLLLFCAIQKVGRRTFVYLGTAILSFAVCMLPYIIWALCNNSLADAINELFFSSLNSKGLSTLGDSSTAAVLGDSGATGGFTSLGRVFNAIFSAKGLQFWVFTLVLAFTWYCWRYRLPQGRKASTLFSLCLVLTTAWVMWLLYEHDGKAILLAPFELLKNGRNNGYLQTATVVLVALLLLCIRCLHAKRFPEREFPKSDDYATFVLTFLLIFAAVGLSHYQLEQNNELYTQIDVMGVLSKIFEIAFHACNVVWFVDIVLRIRRGTGILPYGCWFFVAAADANAIISLIGGGDATYSQNGSLLTVPFALTVFLFILERVIPKNRRGRMVHAGIFVFLGVVLCAFSTICMVRRLITPNSFSGWTSDPIEDRTSYTIDMGRYAGIRTSKKNKLVFEQMQKLITENTDKDDFVWTFPNIKMFNIISDRMVMPTFVPVYFFDVCPDDYAIADAEILRENKPEMIIWKEMGEDTWRTYEKNYRNGNPLGQRQLEKWFVEVRDTDYTLIGTVYNMTVYLRNDLPVQYTYMETLYDTLSSADECREYIQKEEYLHDITHALFPNPPIAKVAYWVAVALILVLSAIAVFYARFPTDWMSMLVCGLYLCTSFSPVLLLLLFVPILWFFYHTYSLKSLYGKITCGLYAAIVILALFMWSGLWAQVKDIVAILCLAVVLAHSTAGIIKLLQRPEKQYLRATLGYWLFVPLALTVFIWGTYLPPQVKVENLCGLYGLETNEVTGEEYEWCNRDAVWRFTGLEYPQEDAYIELSLGRPEEDGATLEVTFGETKDNVSLRNMQVVRIPVSITSSEHTLHLHCEGDAMSIPDDSRSLYYRLTGITLFGGDGEVITEVSLGGDQ